ncbi:putative phytochrome-like histidine kinase PHY2p [Rhexocercosporidium sp. MPI-PUGE-AT-0058]|nr:putative phytochrome-like histidine kinase PHY2p [Rhexocercosporidium sp. MPI-PUGE-AT-0058]
MGLEKPVVFLSSDDFLVERVFPIRNLVGDVNSTSKPAEAQNHVPATDSLDLPIRTTEQLVEDGQVEIGVGVGISNDQKATEASLFLPPPYPPIPPTDAIRRIFPEYHEPDPSKSNENLGAERRRTERTQLVPATSGPPGVFPGIISDPSRQKFHRCEDEPIHTPGAVQQYGVLLALQYDKDGDFVVRIASENSSSVLGYSPEQLFSLKSFLDILDDVSRENIIAQVEHALNEMQVPKELNEDTHLDIFPVTVLLTNGMDKRLWCAVHISKGTKDLVILEFEDFSDVFYHPEVPDKTLPEFPAQTVDIEVHPEERIKSTTRESAPLRVLQIARQKKVTGVSSMNLFNAMIQAQQQLSGAKSVQQVLDLVVGIISELTGFHRVMFYRFDLHKNGCVEAELVNPQASLDLFRGLHFPASDIPQQARELYKINRIRILYDRDAETARLVCRDAEAFAVPLDLSHSYLRAMSPIHLKYLGNMGVRSSMSVSIVIDDDLWGLVACHGYGDLGIQIPLPVRELCRNIGECAATNIQRLLMMQRIEARKPPQKAPPTQNPAGFIAASSADLLRVFDADFGLLSIHDEARAIGRLEPYREALAILAYLQHRRFTTVFASQNINQDFPEIKYPPGIHAISGCLIIPLNVWGNDFLVFFRKGQLREIRWAGNPHEKIKRAGSEYLEPRMSFKRWTEVVAGLSRDWTEDQMETAAILSLLYGRFIEIWRQKDAAGQTDRMTRLLIRNSSHEVRTPLNAIVNYLEMALENPIDDTTRDILSKAHKASRSLIYVIDDLLNLTKAEAGPINSPDEVFDLGETVSEVITQFRKEAMRKSLDLTVSTHQGIPEIVKGDASRLRQVLSNVVSNAFQHSVEGGIKVDIRPIKTDEDSSVIGITVQDAGIGMSESQLDELFQDFEQVIDEDNLSDETLASSLSDDQPLGVGLAVVARYVKNMKGQIRVQSELGKGTIFGIELPFQHAIDSPEESVPIGPLFDPKGPSVLRAMSDTSSAPLAPSPQRELDELQELEEVTPKVIPEAVSPSSVEAPSNLASPGSHSGGHASQGTSSGSMYPFPYMNSDLPENLRDTLSVLIAEDNPINARLLTRRLTKLGHSVEHVNDGQECHDHFALNLHSVDVILMDIQMPLVDGMMSTKMIRRLERELEDLKSIRPRVPIIAVSASLSENKRFDYIQSGFDAWILKPIDFGRLDFILKGIKYLELRRQAVYAPGNWEGGGWFIS